MWLFLKLPKQNRTIISSKSNACDETSEDLQKWNLGLGGGAGTKCDQEALTLLSSF